MNHETLEQAAKAAALVIENGTGTMSLLFIELTILAHFKPLIEKQELNIKVAYRIRDSHQAQLDAVLKEVTVLRNSHERLVKALEHLLHDTDGPGGHASIKAWDTARAALSSAKQQALDAQG